MNLRRSGSRAGRDQSADSGSSPKKNAYIGKIIPNRVDSARSVHIIGHVVPFFDSLSLSRGTANRSGINAKLHRNDEGLRILPA